MTRTIAWPLAAASLLAGLGCGVWVAAAPAVPDTVAALEELGQGQAPPANWLARMSSGLVAAAVGGETAEEPGPPPPDAPLDTLAAYWSSRAQRLAVRWSVAGGLDVVDRLGGGENAALPDEVTRERLLELCEESPRRLLELVELLPASEEAHGKALAILERAAAAGELTAEQAEDVRVRLRRLGYVLRAELVEAGRSAHDRKTWIEHDDDLIALAVADPAAAAPVLSALASSPPVGARTRTLATALLYRALVAAGDEGRATELRTALQGVVADSSAPGRARRDALAALMADRWEGRDEYYLSLFTDPTLVGLEDGHTLYEPLADVVENDPDYWIPRVTGMVSSADRTVHDAAVSCLVQFHLGAARADALRPLLPWLADEQWSSARDWLRLVQSLDRVDLPESVPGLLKVVEVESGYGLAAAAEALAHYHAREAIAPLRRALERERGAHHRRTIVDALISLGAIDDREAAAAIEAAVRYEATPEGRARHEDPLADLTESRPPPSPAVSIGEVLATSPGRSAVAERLLRRARKLEADEPQVASSLREVAARWPLAAVDEDLVARLAAGTLDTASLSWWLIRRSTIDPSVRPAINGLAAGEGASAGIAAALAGDESLMRAVLRGADEEAKQALLVCARYVRMTLPIDALEPLLAPGGGGVLSQLTERYLEVADSPEARALLLARGAPRVIGARPGEDPGHVTFMAFDRWERRLLEELAAQGGPDEVIALLCASYWGCDDQIVVAIWGDRAELRWHDAAFRYRSRPLGEDEVTRIRAFLEEHRADDLGMYDEGAYDGVQYEYAHLHARGGVRVFMNNPPRDPADVHSRLVDLLQELREGKPLTPHYSVAERVAGVEVVFADVTRPVDAVKIESGTLWVRVWQGGREERSLWYPLVDGALGEPLPPEPEPALPEGFDIDSFRKVRSAWRRSGAGSLVLGSWQAKSGAWLVSEGETPRLLLEGDVDSAMLSGDGAWLLATRDDELVVVSLGEGGERTVEVADGGKPALVGWNTPMGRFVVAVTGRAERDRVIRAAMTGEPLPEIESVPMLLDPRSGELTSAPGAPAVVLAASAERLQPLEAGDEGWLAVPDAEAGVTTIGRVDLRSLQFTPELVLPELPLRSSNIWVDRAGGYLYAAIGDLLRIPLRRVETP